MGKNQDPGLTSRILNTAKKKKKTSWCAGGGLHCSLPGAGDAIGQRLWSGRHSQAAPGTLLSCFLLSFHS
jgi:hypothetical protein